MLECPACRRLYPEVLGAPTQVCPHCGHEASVGAAPARGREPARSVPSADPVGALQLAARLAPRVYPRLLLLSLPAVVVSALVGLLVSGYEARLDLPADPTAWAPSQAMRYLGVALPLSLVASTVSLATWVFLSAHVLDTMDGGARAARWRALLAPATALGFVLTLTFAAGVLLLLVGLFVFLHWFMHAPAKLADGAPGFGAALEASRRHARERRAYGFTGLVVLVGALALLPSLVSFPGASGALVGHGLRWLTVPLVPLLVACFVGLAAGHPAPAATAAQPPPTRARQGATRCPRCGARITYEPTGAPVDVVCPSCGTAGRVL